MNKKLESDFANKSIDEVQHDFFSKVLIERKGKYYFREKGIIADENTLLLFQFDNQIIALAKYIKSIKERITLKDIVYQGAYIIDIKSVAIFDPIDVNEIKLIWPKFKGFNQVKQNFPISGKVKFFDLLKKKNLVFVVAKARLNGMHSN